MTQAILLPVRRKALHGAACNHCGLCCQMELCHAAEIAFEGQNLTAPCPALLWRGADALCGLVMFERCQAKPPLIAESLGIGIGCSMPDFP